MESEIKRLSGMNWEQRQAVKELRKFERFLEPKEFKEFEQNVLDEIQIRKSIELLTIFEGMGLKSVQEIKDLSVSLFGQESQAGDIQGIYLVHKQGQR